MQWLLVFLVGLVEAVTKWWVQRGVKAAGYFFGYLTFLVGLFVALSIALYALVGGLTLVIPSFASAPLSFAVGLFPPSTPAFIAANFTAIITKRVFDWHSRITRDFSQSMLNF